MSRAKTSLLPLHTLTPGQLADTYALLFARIKGATREGKPYYSCRFRDNKRTVSCMVWADGPWYEACDRQWQEGQCYKLRALYSEHERYGPQIELHNIRVIADADRADGFDPAQMVQASRFDSDELFSQLTELVEKEIRDEPLRQLVLRLLRRFEQPLKTLPASAKQAYPFQGGLLEHIVSVSRICISLADHYRGQHADLQPPLNRDLIVAGAALHEIGRVLELEENSLAPQPTIPGRLLGYHILGRDLIRDAAQETKDIAPEMLQLLEHLLLSDATSHQVGSQPEAMIPECLILHYAGELDAQMEKHARCLSRDQNRGPFTARDPLLGKRILKQRSV